MASLICCPVRVASGRALYTTVSHLRLCLFFFFFFVFFFFKQKTAYEIRLSLVGSEMCIRDRFKTNDEENNIEIFKRSSPSVVHITNSRLVRSFYSLNPQEVPQGTGTGFIWNEEGLSLIHI